MGDESFAGLPKYAIAHTVYSYDKKLGKPLSGVAACLLACLLLSSTWLRRQVPQPHLLTNIIACPLVAPLLLLLQRLAQAPWHTR